MLSPKSGGPSVFTLQFVLTLAIDVLGYVICNVLGQAYLTQALAPYAGFGAHKEIAIGI